MKTMHVFRILSVLLVVMMLLTIVTPAYAGKPVQIVNKGR
jgi:hypothetical protein